LIAALLATVAMVMAPAIPAAAVDIPPGIPLPSTIALPAAPPLAAPSLGLPGLAAPTPVPPPPLSRFEHYVREETPPGIAADLFQFGYEMFAQAPSTFAPVETTPVGPDYLLGPGDTLRIAVWGKVNEEYAPAVDRNGRINLPVIGTLPVAGLSFSAASDLIKKEILRYFRDINIDVAMGPLRTMQVYLVGRAKQPGCYTISSLSTMVNALFAAGGPSKVGSMRDIQLKRSGKTITRLDLYDLLIKGDKTGDVHLMPEDVIFIPPAGPLVGIAGNVRMPAIYELKNETMATQLIAMAGGINDVGFINRLQVLRVEEGKSQHLFELDLAQVMAKGGGDLKLQGGDLLKVYPVAAVVEKTVHIEGPVKSPGDYGLKAGMTVRDLVLYAGGLRRYASEDAELTRTHVTSQGPVTERIKVNLGAALAGGPDQNLLLEPDDYLFVRAVPEWKALRVVTVSGQVRSPGIYTIAKGERLSQLLERAGGFTDQAYLKGAAFTRVAAKEQQQAQLKEMMDRMEQELTARTASAAESALSPEEASAAKVAAEQRKGFIARMRAVEAKGRVSIKLKDPGELRGTPSDLLLEEGDNLMVPERPGFVQVMGATYNPGAFIYDPAANVSSYLRKAGGPTEEADNGAIYVLKAEGTVVSKQQQGLFGMRWDGEGSRWFAGFDSLRLDPGDTVVVPVQLERVNWLREVKDLTQILYQIAVTAGVMFIAF
jgi:protein involved in polysaccharide export with SLBB domain